MIGSGGEGERVKSLPVAEGVRVDEKIIIRVSNNRHTIKRLYD